MSKRENEFKKDLTALLKKHNASIDMIVEGDTHGIYDEGIGFSFLEPLKNGANFRGWSDTIRLGNGYGLTANDI